MSPLEHFFRHEYARVVAHLTRKFGVPLLEVIEDGVQDAMLTAVQAWQFGRVPDSPAAWVLVVARNKIVNVLRRRRLLDKKLERMIASADFAAEFSPDEELDDFIQFLFLCCHPSLKQEDQIALTLSLAFGFHAREIAAGFVLPEKTLAQRLVRAKRKLKGEGADFVLPPEVDLPARLEAVLRTLYLLFSEGYHASRGDALIRHELCFESIRALRMILRNEEMNTPESRALLSLQLLQAARFPARLDAGGDLLILEEQDRARWDRELIEEGIMVLKSAATGDRLSEYHLLATISALHNSAHSFEETDWARITDLYHELYKIRSTPVVGLNYGISIAMSRGFDAGISFINTIPDRTRLENYCLYYSTLGSLYLENDQLDLARSYLLKARELTDQLSFRKFLDRKLARVDGLN